MFFILSLLSETDHQAVELLQESVSLLCLLCKASRFPVIGKSLGLSHHYTDTCTLLFYPCL